MKKFKKIMAKLLVAAFIISMSAMACPAKAWATDGAGITKVLATMSGTPVVAVKAADITGATSTAGCYFSGITWYDMNGNPISDSFTTDAARVEIRLDTMNGLYFADGLSAYLNNEAVDYQLANNNTTLIMSRVYAPAVWQPTIYKHPGSEVIDEGGWVSFVAGANYADSCTWYIKDASGKTQTLDELKAAYPNITYSDENFGKLILRNIPRELDGSKIWCTFSVANGSSSKDTNPADLMVKYEKPAETPTPTPSPSPSPAEKEEKPARAEDKPQEKEEKHEHSFSREWVTDENYHWHECQCGEISDKGEHSMEWTELSPATKKQPGEEQGECSVCDYMTTRPIEYEKKGLSGSWLLIAGVGVIAVLIVLMIIFTIKRKHRREEEAKLLRQREIQRQREAQARQRQTSGQGRQTPPPRDEGGYRPKH